MEFRRFEDIYVLRLDRGEELIETLMEFVKKEKITLGTINGLGASNYVEVGLFNIETKEYKKNVYEKDMEITSIIGNISTMDNESYLHIHINLSDENNNVIGGHLSKCVISATCELFVQKVEGRVDRTKDEKVGLNLFDFNK